jgi:hypothetical protein
MKPKLLKFRIAFALIVLIFSETLSQEWKWEWAEKSFKTGEDSWTDALHSDLLNNVYCRTQYDQNIFFSDTSFSHPEQWYMNANCAISKYDIRGNFTKALDLFMPPDYVLFNECLVTDSLLNIYLSAEFSYKVYLCDTFISCAPNNYPYDPDVFLAKLSPDYELLWSGLISSNTQDVLTDMVISDDGFLYISCVHHANYEPQQLIYLNQDTSLPFITPMNTLAKVDLNGNLIWKKEIRSEFLGTGTRELMIGKDGQIYLLGTALGHISLDADTIYHPYYPEVKSARFLTIFNQEGEFLDGYFFNWDIWLWETKVNSTGDLYISGMIQDTAVIGSDTIIVPDGASYGVIGKFTPQMEPIWYQLSSESLFWIHLDEDHIIFYVNANGTFEIADTTMNVGNYDELIAGEFDTGGQLIRVITTQCSRDIFSVFGFLDNCKNLILGGAFTGTTIFGKDTLISQNNTTADSFVAKLIRNEQTSANLGPDTLACAEYTLYAPPGYFYYSWNDSISQQNWYTATTPGTYTVACANEEGCWLYDTINVALHPGFIIDLGPDTTIFENQAITFTVPQQYQSYLWSNSVTANAAVVFGESYDPGTIVQVWVQVTDGPCIISDTVYVTIKSELAVENIPENNLFLFPNPSGDFVYIQTSSEIEHIEICDLHGSTLSKVQIHNSPGEVCRISLSNLNQGVYFMKIFYTGSEIIKKIIKL